MPRDDAGRRAGKQERRRRSDLARFMLQGHLGEDPGEVGIRSSSSPSSANVLAPGLGEAAGGGEA